MGHDTLEIPLEVFEEAETKEDLEDWLMANNPVWIAEMKRRVKAMQDGEALTREDLRKRWPTGS